MLEKFVSPLLGKLDIEAEHVAIREFLHALENSAEPLPLIRMLSGGERFSDPRLFTTLASVSLDNPLIVGPGWDKVGHAVRALYELGFGAIEVGSIMARAQPGNPKPRHLMLAPGVPLNRYGFNSPGVEVTAGNLEAYKGLNLPIGINIGKNKDVSEEDAPAAYASVAQRLANVGTYFVINVSSPNTPGLRALQDKEPLTAIVQATHAALGTGKPLFVKIAPDMTPEAINDVIEVVISNNLTGIVATNTTSSEDIKAKYGAQGEMGGVSGNDADFRKMSTDIIRYIYKRTRGKIAIIGAGGVNDASSALEKIRAGASAVEIVAALDEEGPMLPGRINRDIVSQMEKEGVKSIPEIVGVDA